MPPNSIQTKLTYAFIVIALLTALSIYLLVRLTSRTRLRQLLVEQQITEVQADVATWYTIERGWDGFAAYYTTLHPSLDGSRTAVPLESPPSLERDGPLNNRPPLPNTRLDRPPQIGVIDANRLTLAATFATDVGETLPEVYMRLALPVEVDGVIVAYVVEDDEVGVSLVAEEQLYLRNTDITLAVASVSGVALALLMGIWLARVLVRPIQELTAATEAMAAGDLKQQVPIRSHDELGQLAQTFNQMSHDLAEATRQRRQMTADIAHDLSTPLQIISGYVESMVDGTLATTPERMVLIEAEIEQLRRLINDLDLLAQTDTHSLSLQMQPIDSVKFLQLAAQSFTPLASAEGVSLTTDMAASLPAIQGDQERLMQVMGNLLSNALRYTPAGNKIIIAGKQAQNELLLQVQDNGSGIAADDLPYIFERFYRADTARGGGKMGLGLAISKALVEAMNGTITAESLGVGHGTTITIALPILG